MLVRTSQRRGGPEAAAVIWNWRGERGKGESKSPGRTRLIGALQAVGLAAVAVFLFHYWSETVAKVVIGISTLILLTSQLSPDGLYQALLGLFKRLGTETGKAITWLVLALLFYLFFFPFGLLLRRGRSDRLRRYMEPEAPTYWEPRRGLTAASGSREVQY
jgi:hypothetical protein